MQLGELIGLLREEKRLSKRGAAKLLNKAVATWIGIESGRSSPQLANLIEIGSALGFEVELNVHATNRTYLLSERNGKVLVDDRPLKLKAKRLERIAESLTPEQMDRACGMIAQAFGVGQKKRSARAG